MSKYTYLTKSGFERIQGELEDLKTTERQKIAKSIAEAREKGDLSENAEYHAAKEAQGLLEAKISEKQNMLANAKIIDESQLDTSKVMVLSNVKIKHLKTGKEMTYKLVSEAEADSKANKIAITSPIGQGLLGKVIGEIAQIITPAGITEFEVLDITLG